MKKTHYIGRLDGNAKSATGDGGKVNTLEMLKRKRSESDVLSSVRKLLRARGIMHFRRNVGKMKNPRGQWVEFGTTGEADLLAFISHDENGDGMPWVNWIEPVWIECKSSTGKQSREQKLFQEMVEREGHTYMVVRSASEVQDWFEANT